MSERNDLEFFMNIYGNDFLNLFFSIFPIKKKRRKKIKNLKDLYRNIITIKSYDSLNDYWKVRELLGNNIVDKFNLDKFCELESLFNFLIPRGNEIDKESEQLGNNLNKEIFNKFLKIGESKILGNPNINTLSTKHYFFLTILFNYININSNYDICEIGGGFGNMCRLFNEYNGGFKSWVIFDLNFVNKLQKNFLSKTVKNKNIVLNEYSDNSINLINKDKRDIFISNINNIDLTIATHSLSELGLNEFMWYFNNLISKTKYLLYATQYNNIYMGDKNLILKKITYIKEKMNVLYEINTENDHVKIFLFKKK